MSDLALFQVVIEFNIEKCELYATESIPYSDIGKCLSFEEIPLSNRNRCVLSCLYVRMFFLSVSVGKVAHRWVIYRSPSRIDGTDVFYTFYQSILLVTYLFLVIFFLSFSEFSCFSAAERIVRGKTSAPMFSNVAQIQLLYFIYNPS